MAKSIVASMASMASAAPVAVLSDYYYSLKDEGNKKRYKQKIALFQGDDPYVLSEEKLLNQNDPFPDFRYVLNNLKTPTY